jgi:hypothetical protein
MPTLQELENKINDLQSQIDAIKFGLGNSSALNTFIAPSTAFAATYATSSTNRVASGGKAAAITLAFNIPGLVDTLRQIFPIGVDGTIPNISSIEDISKIRAQIATSTSPQQ